MYLYIHILLYHCLILYFVGLGNLFQSILNGLGDSSSETETEVGGGDQPKSDSRQVTESELD